ncbi:hypothetical protein C8R44DRAFT_729076 [Mycena epipterygia]|nr:hypothetical protein C8R44DRAFT_729076 [Mycena epipterygia]
MAELLQARREASARTKELNVQLKLVKGKSGRGKSSASSTALSASSSGRVKSVAASGYQNNPGRKSTARTPNEPAAMDTVSVVDPVQVQEKFHRPWFPGGMNHLSATGSADTMYTQGFACEPGLLADFSDLGVYSTVFMTPPGAGLFANVAGPSTMSNFQADNFDLESLLAAFDPSTRPSFTSSSMPDTSFDFFTNTPFDFHSPVYHDSILPFLPAPPPESAVGSSPAAKISPAPIATRSSRSQIDGLEPANILAPGSSRSRVPRKRGADDEVSEKLTKRRKRHAALCQAQHRV